MSIIAAALAALIAQPAATAPVQKDDRLDLNKVICKSKKVTGTRTQRERTCMTRKQWNELAAESQARTNEQLDYSTRMGDMPR